MARHSSKQFAKLTSGAADLAQPDTLTMTRRHELGVEALCELATEILVAVADSDDDQRFNAPARFVHRYWGISYTALGKETPPGLRGMGSLPALMLLWMCLERISVLTRELASQNENSNWPQVHEMVVAWRDCWGDDERAKIAQARFSTLTGLTRGGQKRSTYLNSALIAALSVVQA
jgi:hypothetical protein